jgi:UDP-N-acetylmuramoylalanine--D-glutamate ligase
MKVTESYAVRKLGFSMKNHPQAAIYNQGHEIIMDLKTIGGQRLNFSLANYPLPGAHNIQNLLAALAAAALMGVDERCMQETIDLASAPRHRLEPAAHRNGVRFINDSKSTTVDSTLMALKAFSEPIILILGGKDKGTDFKLLKPEHQTKLKAIVAYGEVAPRMKDEIAFSGPFVVEQFFDDAVKAAMQLADKGEVVLLSPATSSLDQFKNYEERGNRFCELTQGLAQ